MIQKFPRPGSVRSVKKYPTFNELRGRVGLHVDIEATGILMPPKCFAVGVERAFGLLRDDEVRVVQVNIPAENPPDLREYAFIVDENELAALPH